MLGTSVPVYTLLVPALSFLPHCPALSPEPPKSSWWGGLASLFSLGFVLSFHFSFLCVDTDSVLYHVLVGVLKSLGSFTSLCCFLFDYLCLNSQMHVMAYVQRSKDNFHQSTSLLPVCGAWTSCVLVASAPLSAESSCWYLSPLLEWNSLLCASGCLFAV